MTKFLLLTKYGTAGVEPITSWNPKDIEAHMAYLNAVNRELASGGELIGVQALSGPELAKIVVSDGTATPTITDGPFPEAKELLAGYQMVDVDSEARAIEIAALVSAAPGPRGVPIRQPIEVRQIMGGAVDDI